MARGTPAAARRPSDQNQKGRLEESSLIPYDMPQDQPQHASNLQDKDAMSSAFIEEVGYEDREQISQQVSEKNREESSEEMSSTHQDLPKVQVSSSSTVPIA